jgi:tRNA threonylcarbamoyl adenosine modification protein YeaZ
VNERPATAPRDGRRHAILAIDTATTQVVVGLASPGGEPIAISTWEARHRHGETLLPSLGRLLGEANVRRSRLDGIVVGTGPGAFTGLRVGLATAKGLAHGLGRPLAGVPTAAALISAAAAMDEVPETSVVLLLPAGPSDRVMVRHGEPARVLPAGVEFETRVGDVIVAVDLAGRATDDAVGRGERARARLGHELLRLGAARLSSRPDDLAELVPEYVTLPRGIAAEHGEVSWSRDPR